MTEYEKGHYEGKVAKSLGLEALLPDAVTNVNRFMGYCDGYMGRPENPPEPKEIVEEIISSIDFI